MSSSAVSASSSFESFPEGDKIKDILLFWFGDWADPSKAADFSSTPLDARLANFRLWFFKDDELDKQIVSRFSPLIPSAAAGEFSQWEDTPLSTLALIILLDQFSRNAFRNTPGSFAQDAAALAIAKRAVAKGFDKQLPVPMRGFVYLAYEHSEALADQNECVALNKQLVAESSAEEAKRFANPFLQYAEKHKVVIEKFGRFPHRNTIVGRETTAEEEAYLKEHGGF